MRLSLEAVRERLTQPAGRPLEGQQAIPVATIRDHAYEGPGGCRAEFFGQACGEHRDAHHHTREDHQT